MRIAYLQMPTSTTFRSAGDAELKITFNRLDAFDIGERRIAEIERARMQSRYSECD